MTLGPYLERAVKLHRDRAEEMREESRRLTDRAAAAAAEAAAEDAAADYIVSGVATSAKAALIPNGQSDEAAS